MPNRLIKESIWDSPNLNKLSCEAERYFYRLLPLPDDHGCFQATPSVVKGKCFPLKPEITEENCSQWNYELQENQVCRFWIENDRLFGQFINWEKHQRIRSLHNRKTPFPPTDDANWCQLSSNGAPNPNPNPNPNLNLNLIKETPSAGLSASLSSSNHFSQKVGSFFESIKKSCDQIQKLSIPKNGKSFNPYQWTQKKVNEKKHPGAIDKSLRGIIDLWETIDKPWAYIDKIMITENQNWNEKDSIKIHEEFKKMKPDILNTLTYGILKEI
jgi:hypothetical protein